MGFEDVTLRPELPGTGFADAGERRNVLRRCCERRLSRSVAALIRKVGCPAGISN
jgi:hypothetical protein